MVGERGSKSSGYRPPGFTIMSARVLRAVIRTSQVVALKVFSCSIRRNEKKDLVMDINAEFCLRMPIILL